MKKALILLLFFIGVITPTLGNYHNIGARSIALGKSSSTFSDLWSITNNQAGIAFIERPSLGVAYEQRFRLEKMSLKTIAFVLPTNRIGNFGVSYTYWGDNAYNENRINLGYAMKLGKHFSIGLAFDYLGMNIHGEEENLSIRAFTAEMGILGEPVENLWLAVHAYNLFGTSINNYEYEERIPTLLKLGAMYYFQRGVLCIVEMEKDIDFDLRVKVGIEYTLLEKIILRGGVATQPMQYSGGFGTLLKKLQADFAFYRHQYLGYTPSVAISYTF